MLLFLQEGVDIAFLPEASHLVDIEVFISCGSDVNRYRDIGDAVLRRLQHMLVRELALEVRLDTWDFREAAPHVVPAGNVSSLSLAMVEQSNALVAIFGRRSPRITRQEIRRAFEMRQAGRPVEIFTFMNPGQKQSVHDNFLDAVRDEFQEQIVWTPYSNGLEFQAKLFTTLTAYALRRVSASYPALLRKE